MVDPISLAAISAMLGAVGSGMGGEAGRQLALLIGGLFGRGEPAARRPEAVDELARRLYEAARLLTGEDAGYHLAHVRALRERCVNGPDLAQS